MGQDTKRPPNLLSDLKSATNAFTKACDRVTALEKFRNTGTYGKQPMTVSLPKPDTRKADRHRYVVGYRDSYTEPVESLELPVNFYKEVFAKIYIIALQEREEAEEYLKVVAGRLAAS